MLDTFVPPLWIGLITFIQEKYGRFTVVIWSGHIWSKVWQTPNSVINETLSKKPFDNPFKYPDEIAFKATSNDASIRYERPTLVEMRFRVVQEGAVCWNQKIVVWLAGNWQL